jgi:S-adenosylmethionine hydrolase
VASLPIVTLTTDFGIRDTYVGQMKGALLAVEPTLQVVDLSHQVPPQDLHAGAYLLETGVAAFPEGTIHVAVVDPGVGTDRRAIAVRTARHRFLAPDNGLLDRALERDPPLETREIDGRHPGRPECSATFEGRDRFAPAAARLARGEPLTGFGPEVDDRVRLPRLRGLLRPDAPAGVRVLWVDHFGNAVLDVRTSELVTTLGRSPDAGAAWRLETPAGPVTEFHRTYGEAGERPFLLINSAGYLELALRDGSAAEQNGLSVGAVLDLTLSA